MTLDFLYLTDNAADLAKVFGPSSKDDISLPIPNNVVGQDTVRSRINSNNNAPDIFLSNGADFERATGSNPFLIFDNSDTNSAADITIRPTFQPLNPTTGTSNTNESPFSYLGMGDSNADTPVDLSQLGIVGTNTAAAPPDGMVNNPNTAFDVYPVANSAANGAENHEIVRPFPFGSVQDGTSKTPSMKAVGDFMDNSKKPMMRVVSKFVDMSGRPNPNMVAVGNFVDKSFDVKTTIALPTSTTLSPVLQGINIPDTLGNLQVPLSSNNGVTNNIPPKQNNNNNIVNSVNVGNFGSQNVGTTPGASSMVTEAFTTPAPTPDGENLVVDMLYPPAPFPNNPDIGVIGSPSSSDINSASSSMATGGSQQVNQNMPNQINSVGFGNDAIVPTGDSSNMFPPTLSNPNTNSNQGNNRIPMAPTDTRQNQGTFMTDPTVQVLPNSENNQNWQNSGNSGVPSNINRMPNSNKIDVNRNSNAGNTLLPQQSNEQFVNINSNNLNNNFPNVQQNSGPSATSTGGNNNQIRVAANSNTSDQGQQMTAVARNVNDQSAIMSAVPGSFEDNNQPQMPLNGQVRSDTQIGQGLAVLNRPSQTGPQNLGSQNINTQVVNSNQQLPTGFINQQINTQGVNGIRNTPNNVNQQGFPNQHTVVNTNQPGSTVDTQRSLGNQGLSAQNGQFIANNPNVVNSNVINAVGIPRNSPGTTQNTQQLPVNANGMFSNFQDMQNQNIPLQNVQNSNNMIQTSQNFNMAGANNIPQNMVNTNNALQSMPNANTLMQNSQNRNNLMQNMVNGNNGLQNIQNANVVSQNIQNSGMQNNQNPNVIQQNMLNPNNALQNIQNPNFVQQSMLNQNNAMQNGNLMQNRNMLQNNAMLNVVGNQVSNTGPFASNSIPDRFGSQNNLGFNSNQMTSAQINSFQRNGNIPGVLQNPNVFQDSMLSNRNMNRLGQFIPNQPNQMNNMFNGQIPFMNGGPTPEFFGNDQFSPFPPNGPINRPPFLPFR